MKKIHFVFCGLAGLLIALLIFLHLNRQMEPVSITDAPTTKNLPADVTATTNSILPQSKPAVNASTTTSPEQITNQLANIGNSWSNQLERPISFYGMVIDENLQPIQGANASASGNRYASEKSFQTNVISDDKGLFSITGLTGSDLNVSVGKAGYYGIKTNPERFEYAQIVGATPFEPDPNNPVIFRLRKRGQGAELISGSLTAKIGRDGTPVNIDVLNQTFGKGGPLQLSQQKPTGDWKKATSWSFHMAIPDGGFIEQHDDFPFLAPSTGYQSTIEFHFEKGQTNWARDFRKDYYIKFGNPPIYGRLTILTDISWGGARLTYAVNPDGSQNLEANEPSQ